MERVGEKQVSFLLCFIFFFSAAASKSVSPGEPALLSIPAIFPCTIQLHSKRLSPCVINLSNVSLHSLSASTSSRWRFSSSNFLFSATFASFQAWLSRLSRSCSSLTRFLIASNSSWRLPSSESDWGRSTKVLVEDEVMVGVQEWKDPMKSFYSYYQVIIELLIH